MPQSYYKLPIKAIVLDKGKSTLDENTGFPGIQISHKDTKITKTLRQACFLFFVILVYVGNLYSL